VTLDPEESIADPSVDVICRGEGELPLAELADAVDRGEGYTSIANLWVKSEEGVIRNEMRNLVEDLDSLPFPDRRLYTGYEFFQRRGKRSLMLGRGSPTLAPIATTRQSGRSSRTRAGTFVGAAAGTFWTRSTHSWKPSS
jgi:radical SAM superfamily enzyme YgiQ (UPF0313 family)